MIHPWEYRNELGVFKALILTSLNAVLRPVLFFRTLAETRAYASPLLYAMIAGLVRWLVIPVSVAVSYGIFYDLDINQKPYLEIMMKNLAAAGYVMLLSPIFVGVSVFLAAGISHGLLVAVQGNKHGFNATFQVVCYGSVTTSLLHWIPVVGVLLGGMLYLFVGTIGFKEMHRISYLQASVVQIPTLLSLYFMLYMYYLCYQGHIVGGNGIPFPIGIWGIPPVLLAHGHYFT